MWSIFINSQKAFDAMDRENLPDILKDTGMGPSTIK
jgi:hypothetical protein